MMEFVTTVIRDLATVSNNERKWPLKRKIRRKVEIIQTTSLLKKKQLEY